MRILKTRLIGTTAAMLAAPQEFSVTVTGDIGSFKADKVLKSDKQIAAYYRILFNDGAENETTLTDAEIVSIVKGINTGDNDADEISRCEAMEAGKLPSNAAEPITARNNSAQSYHLGAELSEVEGFDDEMQAIILGDEKVKAGPLAMMFLTHNAKGTEWMNGLAVPDSKTGNNAETYKVKAKDATTGESKEVNGNAFTDMVAGTAFGKAWREELEQLKLASNPETRGQAKSPWKEKGGDTEFCVKRAKLLTSRLTAARSQMKRMAKCWFKKFDIEGMQGVGLEFDTDTENGVETLAEGRYPVTLRNSVGKAKEYKPLSVSQFIALDVTEAKKIGGNMYEALLKTLERGVGDTTPKAATLIGTPAELFVECARINNYLDWQSDAGKKHQSMLIDYFRKPEHKEEMLAFGRMAASIDPVYGAIQKLYDDAITELALQTGDKSAAAKPNKAA